MEGKLNSSYYHSKAKGCEIESRSYPVKYGRNVDGDFCKTHNKEICRCGWEFGFHEGEESKLLED